MRQFTDSDREKALETRRKGKQIPDKTQTKTSLDDLEREMAQQLRIMNMHRMMMTLSEPPAPAQQQMSSLKDMVSVFKDLNSIKQAVRSEVTAESYDDEPESMEEKMIMQLLPSLLNKNQAQIQAPDNAMKLPNNINIAQIKSMIKQGSLSKEQAKQLLVDYNIKLSDQEFEQRWKELSE